MRDFQLLALVALVLVGCESDFTTPPDEEPTGEAPPRPHDDRLFIVSETAFGALAGATAYHGTYEGVQGMAGYRIEVPNQWNGVLVLYAHGYRGTGPVLTVGLPPAALRSHWIANGYAWAASSFSANYYDIRAGIEDTNELALRFVEFTGTTAPSKYYIAGQSMGGHIAGAAVETEVRATAQSQVNYAAAYPMCGVMGDVELYNYFLGYNVAAHHLAGVPIQAFPIANHEAKLPTIKAALWANYEADQGTMTAQGDKLRNALMYLSGGPRPTFDFAFPDFQDLLLDYGNRDGDGDGVFGGLIINTTDISYQLDADPALSAEEVAFNAAIFRIQGDFLEHNPLRSDGVRAMPIIEGRFTVPVLTLHTLGDLFVPFSMQQIYARRAADHGNGNRLVQRAIRATGHCVFQGAEYTDGWDALVAWELNGIKPGGDDVLTPAAVANASYGCTFTTATRAGIPAC